MSKHFYLLCSCNQWKEYSSMKVIGVTESEDKLCVMVGTQLKAGYMTYKHDSPKESLRAFVQDYQNGRIDWDLLEYGYVEAFEDYAISNKNFLQEFPKATYIYKMLMGKV